MRIDLAAHDYYTVRKKLQDTLFTCMSVEFLLLVFVLKPSGRGVLTFHIPDVTVKDLLWAIFLKLCIKTCSHRTSLIFNIATPLFQKRRV